MNNLIKLGKTMTYTAPAGGVTDAVPLIIGGLFVVPMFTAAAAAQFEGLTEGVVLLNKTTGEGAVPEGASLYWDATNLKTSLDCSIGLPIGTCATVGGQLTGDATCQVRLHGMSLVGRPINVRKRATIAVVNAGFTLAPAIPGMKYRLIDANAIAVGGAVTTVTTVDLKGVQATVAVKLVAFTQASLTQSAMVRAGGAGGTLLADGASLVDNDANTALTVGITGANITVATNVDFNVTYQLEAL